MKKYCAPVLAAVMALVLCMSLLFRLESRKAEIQVLSEQVDASVASWQAIAEEKETLQTELGQLQSDLREANLSIEENTIRIEELTVQVDELRTEHLSLTNAVEAAQNENTALTEAVDRMRTIAGE